MRDLHLKVHQRPDSVRIKVRPKLPDSMSYQNLIKLAQDISNFRDRDDVDGGNGPVGISIEHSGAMTSVIVALYNLARFH